MKYFFFDIDGTLTTKNPGGIILPSTLKTLEKLRENGHFVAIATGRAEHNARPFREMCHIENMVHDGGNGITINGELQYIEPLEKEKAMLVINECLEKNIPFCITMNNSKICYSHNDAFMKDGEQYAEYFNLEVIKDLDYKHLDGIYKIYIALNTGDEYLLESLKTVGYLRYFDHHLNIEPDDKVKGIKTIVEKMGGTMDDVVVFGDGHNDLTMVKAANIGIAMGNAINELKEAADFVTKRSDEDGVEYACKHFGWI